MPGVFLGTATWYAVLSGGATLSGSSLPRATIRVLGPVAGAMLIGFGPLMLIRWGA